MDQNSSSQDLILLDSDLNVKTVRTIVSQVFMCFFIHVDVLMLFTFFSKQAFRSNARYILFAHTLLSDCILLLLVDLVVLLSHFSVVAPVGDCLVLCMVMGVVVKNTPYTLTAMCLERYVAICMPLRHASISTTGKTMAAIAIIWTISSVRVIIDVIIVSVVGPPGYFSRLTLCHYHILLVTGWQHLMFVTFNQVEFGIIVIIILFCYTKIMLAAQAASGENKESASKGRRTLLFHSLQLILCMADLWGPYLLAVVAKQIPQLFLHMRFLSFLGFTIISRALSPLIYGLRDKTFCLALKYYLSCKAQPRWRNIST